MNFKNVKAVFAREFKSYFDSPVAYVFLVAFLVLIGFLTFGVAMFYAPADRLTVQVQSFSYKRGLPDDTSGNGGGFVFDCRALPNPGRYEQYRAYTGKDRPVVEFLEKEPAVAQFLTNAKELVGQSIEKYMERRFTHLSVAFGCTGGQHRSVYCAEQLARWIGENWPDVAVDLSHRER